MIAIDGKTVRRSYDQGKNKGAIQMVNAWASQNRLVLGQRKVDDKSNEITAISELLKVLDINGCIVTIRYQIVQVFYFGTSLILQGSQRVYESALNKLTGNREEEGC